MDAKDFMPDEAAIAAIRARLERYEAERKITAARVRLRVPIYLGVLLAMVLVLAWAFNSFADPNEQWFSSPHVFLYVGGAIAGFVAYAFATRPATDLQQAFREQLFPIVFGFIKDFRYRRAAEPDSYGRLPHEVIGSFNRRSFDDVISGTYGGFAFELYEASFSTKSGKTETRVFRGVVMAFELMTPFPGLLVATRKSGKIASFFSELFGGSRLEELKSGHEPLDSAYDFRSDNVEAARPLVGGHLAQALQWLGETWPGEPVRIALRAADGFLLIPHDKNFFELPGIGTTLDYSAHIAPMLTDMAQLLATASLVRKVGTAEATAAGQDEAGTALQNGDA
jgi:hypothetical protein